MSNLFEPSYNLLASFQAEEVSSESKTSQSKIAEILSGRETKPLPDLGIDPICSIPNEIVKDGFREKVSFIGSKEQSLTAEETEQLVKKFFTHVKKSSWIPADELYGEEDFEKALQDLGQASLIEVGGKKILLFPDQIGSGGKGEIFLGITVDGKMCAVKRYFQSEDSVQREANILRACQGSPHIIGQYASNDQFLVLEYCRYSLDDLDYRTQSIDPDYMNQYIDDMLGFLVELEEKGVIHLDIKPDNLRLRLGHVKLLDFDTAFSTDEKQNMIGGGTIGYYDPNQIAYYCQKNEMLLADYKVPGFDGSTLASTPPTLETNAWQTMIALAEIGFHSLSVPFQESFKHYQKRVITSCIQKANEHIANSDWLELSGFSYIEFQKKYPTEFNARFTLLYMGYAHLEFEKLKSASEGLFTELTPTSPFEQLLIDMSYFNEDQRIKAEKIREKLQNPTEWIGI